MNYFLKKHKLVAWVILLTFLFTTIMPTNLAGMNSKAEAAASASPSDKASFFYVKTPTSNPDANDTSQFGDELGTGYLNTMNATWSSKSVYGRTIYNSYDSVDNRVVKWPNGFENGIVPKTSKHWKTIFDAYKAEVSRDLGIEITADDVDQIILQPYKMSDNNYTGTSKLHMDCKVEVKVKGICAVNYYLWDVGETGYKQVKAENKKVNDTTENPTYPETKTTKDGKTYRLQGWYNNSQLSGSPETFPYTVTQNVNFYAKYVEEVPVTINYVVAQGDGAKGIVSRASESLAPATGTAQGSVATAATGYRFVNWTNAAGEEVSQNATFVPEKVNGLNVAATYTAHFVKDDNQTKELKYTVNYYKDNVKVGGDSQTEKATVWVNDPDTLTVDKTKINTVNKYVGYKLDAQKTGTIPGSIANNGVINVYYVKDDSQTHSVSAQVEYYYGATLAEAKAKITPDATDEVATATGWIGEAVTVEVAPNTTDKFAGYNYNSTEGELKYTVEAWKATGSSVMARAMFALAALSETNNDGVTINKVKVYYVQAQDNVTITGKKIWQNTEGKTLPASIEVELFRDGVSYKTTETALDWTYSFGELPKYALEDTVADGEAADGHAYVYTVTEKTVVEGFTAYYDRTVDENGNQVINITNMNDAVVIPIKGMKHWFDNLRDEDHGSVTIELHQRGQVAENIFESKVIATTQTALDWTYDFGYVPKYDAAGNPFEYYVTEKDVPMGYVSVVNGFDVNNVLISLYEMGNITIGKEVVNTPATQSVFDFTLLVKAKARVEGGLDEAQQRLQTLLATAKVKAERAVEDTQATLDEAIAGFSVVSATTSGSSYQFIMTQDDSTAVGITTGSALYVDRVDEYELGSEVEDSSLKDQIVKVIDRLADEFVHAVAAAKEAAEDIIAMVLEDNEEPAVERPSAAVMLKEIAKEVEVTSGSAIAFSENDLNSMFDAMVAQKQAVVEYDNVEAAWEAFQSQVTTTSAIVLIVNGDVAHPISLDPEKGRVNEETGCIEFIVEGFGTIIYDPKAEVYQIPFTLMNGGEMNFSLQATTTGSSVQYRVVESDNVKVDANYVQTFIVQGEDKLEALETQWATLTSGSAIGYLFRNEYSTEPGPGPGPGPDPTPDPEPTPKPDPKPPVVPIPDPEVPQGEPEVIPEEDVPLVDVPGEEVVETPVPLGNAPRTGDSSKAFAFAMVLLAAGLGLVVTRRKFD